MPSMFPILILNARPAAGKSEISAFLRQVPLQERVARYHIGSVQVVDDFPMLWSWFEEDEILEQVFQRPRLHTTPEGYFVHQDLWHLLIRRIGQEYEKGFRESTGEATAIIEFSRGLEHGGYRAAYEHLTDPILSQAACLYVRVSYEESLRKNRARFNPDRPYSILEHGLSDEKMERLYREDDWDSFVAADASYVQVRDFRLPYVVFENHDDVTTSGGSALESRLETCLNRLWGLWHESRTDRGSKENP